MQSIDRRTFTRQMMTSVVSYALLESLFASEGIGKAIRPITQHWAIELNTYCADLHKQSLSLTEWQDRVEGLFRQVELDEVLRFIEFDNLTRGFSFPDLGVHTKYVNFPRLEGLPEKTVFVKKIFGMQKGRAIIPHGHSNMCSAHLILKGDMHLRHYDKIRREGDHLFIRPTLDKTVRAGDCSSISDERDNVHWFIANSEQAFTFDVILLDIAGKKYDIHNLDMEAAEPVSGDQLRVPILDVETALKKYGKERHH